jgi:hypothetical protein
MTMSQTSDGVYLYCVLRADEPPAFTSKGIGERGGEVSTVQVRDLVAVLSASPVIEYEQSRRNLLAHTRVLEEAMQHGTILPVRFGVVAPGAAVVRDQLLDQRYAELDAQLRSLDGLMEVGLKAFWYEGAIFDEILNTHEDIRQLRDSLVGKSADATYYERIRLGQMIEAAMQQRRETDAAQILDRLRPLAREVRSNKTITDRMVVNAAFLIERTLRGAFEEAVDQLDRTMGERMLFKFLTEAPPYNFVNLTLQWNQAPES